jgi:hypothetical protein
MSTPADAILERLLKGEGVDAAGATVPAGDLVRLLYALSRGNAGPSTVALTDATIDGDILLDALGERGRPLALQLIGCKIRGLFRARSSHWRQLVIAKSEVRAIDIPRSRVIGEASFEDVRATSWLEASGCEFLGALLLNGASFKNGDRDRAIVLADSRIGLSISAHRMDVEGGINANRLNVAGMVRFDGSQISSSDNRAVNMADATVGAEVAFAPSNGTPFRAFGAVILASARIGALDCTAAQLQASPGPALVLERANVNGAVNMSGAHANHRFRAEGGVSLVAAHVAFQVQAVNADMIAPRGLALTADSATIDGDVLLGHEHGDFVADGDVTLNNAKIGGRVLLSHGEFKGNGSAFALRQSEVRSEVAIYDCQAIGAVRLDNTRAWGLTIKGLAITRSLPPSNFAGLPEGYAHEADALLDFSAAHFVTDIHMESLVLEEGDCRLVGANIGGGFSLTNANITPAQGYALIAQSAQMGSFALSGARDAPLFIRGDINLMGSRIAGSATLVDLEAAHNARPVAVHLKAAQIDGDLQLHRVTLAGELNAISTQIKGNCIIAGSSLGRPKASALDVRNSRISGYLSFEVDDPHGERTDPRIDGVFLAAGAHLGGMKWKSLHASDGAAFFLTDMRIEGAFEPELLFQEGVGFIDLSGSHAGDLADALDAERDGWGAGRMKLALDAFQYARLRSPSGRDEQSPSAIRTWRTKWLSRRLDERSAQAGRHLASVLRQQGLHEAARLTLIDAFSAEVEQRPLIPRALGRAFGWAFGHGLGGWNAFWTVVSMWLWGIIAVADMQANDLLVRAAEPDRPAAACGSAIDPGIYAADVMIPLLDLGQEKLCVVGTGPGFVTSRPAEVFEFMGAFYTVGEWELARFLWSIYALAGWVVVSLAIATWSGVFRRGGRE